MCLLVAHVGGDTVLPEAWVFPSAELGCVAITGVSQPLEGLWGSGKTVKQMVVLTWRRNLDLHAWKRWKAYRVDEVTGYVGSKVLGHSRSAKENNTKKGNCCTDG